MVWRALAVLMLLGFTEVARGAYPCEFDVYRPGPLFDELRFSLQEEGIAILPPEISIPGLPPFRRNIARGTGIVGQVELRGDIRLGGAELIIYDTKNMVLAKATYAQFPCPPRPPRGMCEQVTFDTEIGATPAPNPQFVLRYGADTSGVQGFRYGQPVGNFTWRMEFRDSFRWLVGSLVRPLEIFEAPVTGPKSRLVLLLSADALTAPYAFTLRFVEAGGQLRIYGRVPSNAVYGMVIDRARAAGYVNVAPWMTIDTGMPRPPIFPEPGTTISACR